MNKQITDRNKADMQTVIKTAQGRRVLWRILQAAQTEQHGFVPGDPHATSFHCGQRSVGLFIKQAVGEVSPAALLQMENEYLSELVSAQASADRQQDEFSLD